MGLFLIQNCNVDSVMVTIVPLQDWAGFASLPTDCKLVWIENNDLPI